MSQCLLCVNNLTKKIDIFFFRKTLLVCLRIRLRVTAAIDVSKRSKFDNMVRQSGRPQYLYSPLSCKNAQEYIKKALCK